MERNVVLLLVVMELEIGVSAKEEDELIANIEGGASRNDEERSFGPTSLPNFLLRMDWA